MREKILSNCCRAFTKRRFRKPLRKTVRIQYQLEWADRDNLRSFCSDSKSSIIPLHANLVDGDINISENDQLTLEITNFITLDCWSNFYISINEQEPILCSGYFSLFIKSEYIEGTEELKKVQIKVWPELDRLERVHYTYA